MIIFLTVARNLDLPTPSLFILLSLSPPGLVRPSEANWGRAGLGGV